MESALDSLNLDKESLRLFKSRIALNTLARLQVGDGQQDEAPAIDVSALQKSKIRIAWEQSTVVALKSTQRFGIQRVVWLFALMTFIVISFIYPKALYALTSHPPIEANCCGDICRCCTCDCCSCCPSCEADRCKCNPQNVGDSCWDKNLSKWDTLIWGYCCGGCVCCSVCGSGCGCGGCSGGGSSGSGGSWVYVPNAPSPGGCCGK